MPEIPILCLGRTEAPPKWVKQTELWWPAPTHCGTLTQSDPEKGKPGTLSTPNLQQLLISPFWDLCKPQWAQPLQAQCLCPGLCCQSADSGALPGQTIPEAGMCCSCCFVLNSHPRIQTKSFQLPALFCCCCCLWWWHRFVCCSEWLQPQHGNKIKEIALKAGLAY